MSARAVFRDERGASLILALTFLTFMSVFCVSILAFTSVGATTTRAVANETAERYAADAGMEFAIGNLAADSSKCASSGPTYPWPTINVNDRFVRYECTYVRGGEQSDNPFIGEYALQTTVAGISVSSSSRSPLTFNVDGSVHSEGSVSTQSTRKINIDGDLTLSGSCPSSTTYTVTGVCTANEDLPGLTGSGGLVIPNTTAPASQNYGSSCTILYPGRYGRGGRAMSSSFFSASRDYYFASGSYYFNNVTMRLQGRTVFGGAQGASETKHLTSTPCADDVIAKQRLPSFTASGTGVSFLLDGSSTMRVQGANTKVELFSRVPGGSDAGSVAGVGVIAYPNDDFRLGGGSYSGSSVRDPSTVFSITSKAADAVLHGFAFMPSAGAAVSVISNSQANGAPLFAGGARLSRIALGSDSDANTTMNIASWGGTEASPRVVTLRSTACATATNPCTASENPTTITATATFEPDSSTPVISEWRVT